MNQILRININSIEYEKTGNEKKRFEHGMYLEELLLSSYLKRMTLKLYAIYSVLRFSF